jgi:Spy/CpxP family protein refolding chaperone
MWHRDGQAVARFLGSPDGKSGAPLVAPQVLGPDELPHLRSAASPATFNDGYPTMTPRIASVLFASALATLGANAASPYAEQTSREIKALSADDVGGLLAGKGMGWAKAAELNGFAGPAHVLELATELHLTPEQRARTEALFAAMSAKAAAQGRLLVDAEAELDTLFAARTVTPERLTAALGRIGALQAAVRHVHLEAHLAQVAILSDAQNARYGELRGYRAAGQAGATAHRH